MKVKIFSILLLVALMLPSGLLAQGSPLSKDPAFKEAIRTVIKENPELVLDVLKDNSELVLEVAKQGSEQRKRKIYAAKWRSELGESKEVNLQGRPIRGNVNAPVTIVAYSDFTCPYCQQGTAVVANVMAEYKDKVRFVFKHMPLEGHAHARVASEYVVAAFMQDEVKGWEYYDLIFSQRENLLTEGEAFLRKASQSVGLNMQKLIADAKSRKVKAIIDEDIAEANKIGVQGTPYFLVNNLRIPGVVSEDLFGLAVDIALEGK